VRLDSELYAPEASLAAAAAFADRAELSVAECGAAVTVTIRRPGADARELQRLAGEIRNEALNQDLRLSTVRKNARLLGMLVAASLRTAAAAALLCALVVLPASAATAEEKTPCADSSAEGILGGYGTIWGKGVSEQRGIPLKASEPIVERLTDLQACKAVVEGRRDACSALSPVPGAAERCGGLASAVPFQLFLAGRSKDPSACHRFFAAADLGGAGEEEFCGAARRLAGREGQAGLCAALTGGPGREHWKQCVQQFPPAAKACADAGDFRLCASLAGLYAAVSAQDLKRCPPSARRVCEAAIAGPGRDPCGSAAKDLEAAYCREYRAAWKRTRGQVGLTDEGQKMQEEINRHLKGARSNSKAAAGGGGDDAK
jgi:hypothetical protein